ncbi:MAG: helix-turn-helix transcriptional regulator [Roseburia sp.]|nr:helix-turn-helix transcriptional regulator [Roseburia sp.]
MENKFFVDIFNELLDEKGLNRKQFAEKSGIPYTTVVGWTKMNRLPDYSALIKIADFFNCSIDYIVGRQDEFGNIIYSAETLRTEFDFLKYFRKLEPENKELVIGLIKKLAKSRD